MNSERSYFPFKVQPLQRPPEYSGFEAILNSEIVAFTLWCILEETPGRLVTMVKIPDILII